MIEVCVLCTGTSPEVCVSEHILQVLFTAFCIRFGAMAVTGSAVGYELFAVVRILQKVAGECWAASLHC